MPVISAGKSRNNKQTSIEGQWKWEVKPRNWTTNNTSKTFQKNWKGTHIEKAEVLDKCLNILKEQFNPKGKRQCHFSIYITEKPANFDWWTRVKTETKKGHFLARTWETFPATCFLLQKKVSVHTVLFMWLQFRLMHGNSAEPDATIPQRFCSYKELNH